MTESNPPTGNLSNEEPRKRRMPVWSLILGIVGLVCVALLAVIAVIPAIMDADFQGPEVKLGLIVVGLCSGILAIVAAHVVIPRLQQEAPIFKEHGFAIAGLITGYLTVIFQVVILGVLFLTSFVLFRSQAKVSECTDNLREMWLACRLFAEDHDGQLPVSLDELKGYVAPSQERPAGPFSCPINTDPSRPSYEIRIVGKLSDVEHPDRTVLIRETDVRHGRGRRAIYANGDVITLAE
jgi:hypothetical protein